MERDNASGRGLGTRVCNVLGITGSQGKGINQYGEAHLIALDSKENIYVADTLNWRVQVLVKKAAPKRAKTKAKAKSRGKR